MQIKPIQNFVHAPSRRSFQIGKVAEVSDQSAKEWIVAGLAVDATESKPEKTDKKAK